MNDNNDVYSTINKSANLQTNLYNDQTSQNYYTFSRKLQQNNNQTEQKNQEQLNSRLSMPFVAVGNTQNQSLQKQRPIVTVSFSQIN